MEAIVSRQESHRRASEAVSDATDRPGRRRLRLERAVAHVLIHHLRPSRRAQGWPIINCIAAALRRRLRLDLRKQRPARSRPTRTEVIRDSCGTDTHRLRRSNVLENTRIWYS